ncbi:hypothetical protein [Aestuariibaculum sediminum]|uniref:Uncharacterized protein n=1 Tax=Aestuariibaculum sediminum TaxID=2770637 RepID=A0A8J6UI31_9FLAO|nr:hypothetical protein [Aestuariibaculum sediminum]MBD0833746.1 hypothetical protein [Aestuariibaculum sediminum]
MESSGMTKKEKALWVNTLTVATDRLIRVLQKGEFVTHTEFVAMLEEACKDEVMLLFVNKLAYSFEDGYGPYVKIKCSLGKYKFKVRFFMAEPAGKFEDRTPVPYGYSLETNF